jgi:hypothetical protein
VTCVVIGRTGEVRRGVDHSDPTIPVRGPVAMDRGRLRVLVMLSNCDSLCFVHRRKGVESRS